MNGFKTIFTIGMLNISAVALADTNTDNHINNILQHTTRTSDLNAQIKNITTKLAGWPYLQAKGVNNPLYRMDAFDCQTLVQTTLALLHSTNALEFSANYIKIAYGAMAKMYGQTPTFYNRNHFVEVDLNPINRKNGWFSDVTAEGSLAAYTKTISATIDRQSWFAKQGHHLKYDKQTFSITYIPKENIVLKNENGFKPNRELLAKIPTPSVVEIINDPARWMFHGKNIKTAIGTELTISHMGLLYNQKFKKDEIIYHRIICDVDWRYHKKCDVYPITCKNQSCNELMLVHATTEYPSKFYWYKTAGNYVCSRDKPASGKYTKCNRVEQIPLFAYLTNYHYGNYWIMTNPALLGIHLEKIS